MYEEIIVEKPSRLIKSVKERRKPVKQLISMYDMPIYKSRRPSVLRAVDSELLSQIRMGRSSRNLSRLILSGSTRFIDLDDSVLQHFITTKTGFGFARDLSLSLLNNKILNTLNTLRNCYECKYARNLQEPLPNNVFSWSATNFFLRRKIKNVVWIDLLCMSIPPLCMEVRKFLVDLSELIRICGSLLANSPRDSDQENESIPAIEDAMDLLKLEKRLAVDLSQNTTEVRKLINTSISYTISSNKDASTVKLKLRLINETLESDVLHPLMRRVCNSYNKTQIDQAEMYYKGLNNKILKQIAHYRTLARTEMYCAQCSLDSQYAEMENFKARIEQLTTKFENQFETIENEIVYKKLSLEKLNTRKKFLIEQMDFFTSEIENMRQRELQEKFKQKEQELLLLEEALKEQRKSKSPSQKKKPKRK